MFQPWDSDLTSDDTINGALDDQFTDADLSAGVVTLNGSGGLTSVTFKVTQQWPS